MVRSALLATPDPMVATGLEPVTPTNVNVGSGRLVPANFAYLGRFFASAPPPFSRPPPPFATLRDTIGTQSRGLTATSVTIYSPAK